MDADLEQHNWIRPLQALVSITKAECYRRFFVAYGVRFGSAVTALYGAVLEQSDAINAVLSQRKWTLIHGDLRADNLLFDANSVAPKSVILDWSWAARVPVAMQPLMWPF